MRDIKYFFEQKVLNFLLPVTDRYLIHHQQRVILEQIIVIFE